MPAEAAIANSLVRETSLPIEMCLAALSQSKNDLSSARRILTRWKEKTTAPTISKFGTVCSYFYPAYNAGAIVEVSCDSEYLSDQKDFSDLITGITAEITYTDKLIQMQEPLHKLEEQFKCQITYQWVRYVKENELSLITTYSHRGKIAVMVETEVENAVAYEHKAFRLFSFDLALHIAANDPQALNKEGVPAALKQKLTTTFERQLQNDGKEMRIWAIASAGKFDAWCKENTLLSQDFIKNEHLSVEEARQKTCEIIQSGIRIKRFARLDML